MTEELSLREKIEVNVTISMTCSKSTTVKVPVDYTVKELREAVIQSTILPLDDITEKKLTIEQQLKSKEFIPNPRRKYLEILHKEYDGWNIDEFEVIED